MSILEGTGQEAVPAGRFRLREASVIADVLDGETIILNLEAGDYYALNASAGALWQLIIAGRPVAELPAAIAERLGQAPAMAEVDGFVARLLGYRLIEPAGEPAGQDGDGDGDGDGAGEPDLAAVGAWSAPEITVYADMKDLLAIDPPLPPLRAGHHP